MRVGNHRDPCGLGLGEEAGQHTSELLGAGQASKLSDRLRVVTNFLSNYCECF